MSNLNGGRVWVVQMAVLGLFLREKAGLVRIMQIQVAVTAENVNLVSEKMISLHVGVAFFRLAARFREPFLAETVRPLASSL